jgi:hypothetical protein
MNLKKFSLITLLLLVLLTAATVYSTDAIDMQKQDFKTVENGANGELSIDNGVLTLDNYTFKIPEGFVEVENYTIIDSIVEGNEMDMIASRCAFMKDNQGIEIKIMCPPTTDNGSFTEPSPQAGTDGVYKTIAGKKGVLLHENSSAVFAYLDNGNLIQIRSTDENLINQIIQ